MKKLFLLSLFSLSALSSPRIYDPKNILVELDFFLNAKPFNLAFNLNQSTLAEQRTCQYQYRGIDSKWQAVNCSFTDSVNYWVSQIDFNQITVNYRSSNGYSSYSIARDYYEFVRGNQLRRILDRSTSQEAEVLDMNIGISTAGGKSINTRTIFLRNWIFYNGSRISYYEKITLSNDVPYISQIVDYSAYDTDISLNRLIDFRN